MNLVLELARYYDDKIKERISIFRGSYFVARKLNGLAIDSIMVRDNQQSYKLNLNGLNAFFIRKRDARCVIMEKEFLKTLRDRLSNDKIFCDVGAYHGFHSVIYGSGKTYSFEPDPQNFRELKKTVHLNNDKNIEVLNKAVWSDNSRIKMKTGEEGVSHVSKSGEDDVETTTLDAFFEDKQDPDVLKIDVEGAEDHVLKGAEKLLKRSKPEILVEFHPDRLRDSEYGYKWIKEFLKDLGYNFSDLRVRGDQEMVLATHKDSGE